ncbi:similar to Saccharomyces cerevisiae YGL044C RNA15 Cleavage and polyadenylation factor I (CF I) component involved in cleavage and polyadenylation of mRNA 3' ends [Maudiozyma barnettii]|uniref:Similar to Saccharomyces cerevisiae YGL044C RNA15 Cleavage and polyadenylation factor I (CF I) component involved in cleavage and polyadenylation of mRNA 3' ends n=1 Tax=Maudiozyma barnettii TaxID=61262 RepID=A0A8H2VJ23_9SACH|nr:similar to Saccharomyces cerevisiae YGL044C RNA15 Cleavage and polyadenylation factor I (CF I) component involved in cleavage and polyadenylation of mRNA 3' ends [Kazachstania barnettii]CAB4256564.1 similar to Saccharomyces cerevisiae YGL044C RNA15 Cleavage and polyadenylation factor I (CF I) component involved in cleavage and polyadenylation of mRNA 3' ends [Kazachstania barnettii]CAD1785167.1 similar to Saccharomyces cerevisiae YGL044C RNA15 Cleavage and polyadenylation factor I (CF I) compo
MNQGNNSNNTPSRVVYLGSIPYDQTEQQILDLCRNVGPVVNMKMMFDPQTGKSKGYAFIEFKDLDTSASAVRNLNGYQLGSRFLKCGYSNNNDLNSVSGSSSGSSGSMGDQNDISPSNLRFADLPTGIDVNINMTTPAMMISSELSKIDKNAQLDLLRGFQEWSKNDGELAIGLLTEYPQLTYVIAELMLTNGIAKVDDLTQLASSNNKGNQNGVISSENENKNTLSNDPETQQKQKDLLRQVLQLNDGDISILPDDERMTLWDLKQRAMRGDFGGLL